MDNDIHAQTARELFGVVTPATRRMGKDANFARVYGGNLFPYQQELLDKAKEMTHRAWPGLNLDCGKTGEPIIRDEVSIIIKRKPRC